MKNHLKVLAVLVAALTGGAVNAAVVTYDDGAVASQIVCGSDQDRQGVIDDMLAQQARYKRAAKLFAQPMPYIPAGQGQGQGGDCFWYRLHEESKKQRQ